MGAGGVSAKPIMEARLATMRLSVARRVLMREVADAGDAPLDAASNARLYHACHKFLRAYRRVERLPPPIQLRRLITCRDCRKERRHAAHGYCDTCYRRHLTRAKALEAAA